MDSNIENVKEINVELRDMLKRTLSIFNSEMENNKEIKALREEVKLVNKALIYQMDQHTNINILRHELINELTSLNIC